MLKYCAACKTEKDSRIDFSAKGKICKICKAKSNKLQKSQWIKYPGPKWDTFRMA